MPTPHHRLSSVLAARTQHRQVDVVYRADQAAVGVDRAIGSVWQQLLAVLKTDHGWAVNYQRVRHVMQRLQPVLQAAVAKRLEAQAILGHRSAAKVLAQTLPLEYLRAAAPIPVEAVESRHGLEDVLCATVDLDRPADATRPNRGRNPASITEDVVSSHARAIEELTHAQVTESTDAPLLELGDSAGGAVGAAVPVPDVLADRPGPVRSPDVQPGRCGQGHDQGSPGRLDVRTDHPADRHRAGQRVSLTEGYDHDLAGAEAGKLPVDSHGPHLAALRLPADADDGRRLAQPSLLPLVQLTEDDHEESRTRDRDGSRRDAGLSLCAPGAAVLDCSGAVALTEDETDPGTGPEPAVPEPSGDALRRLFQALLFPPPPLQLVQSIVFGSAAGQPAWPARIASLSRLAPPEVLATTVANGFSQGLSQRAIAELLEPMVNNVRASARRIARTEGLRVSHAVQQRCHDQLGDLVIAYQVHATLDQNTRSWHAARSGTVYYRNPGPGEKGPQQQPNPPEEAADASERPAGTPQTAPNCRCYISPVMAPQQDIIDDPAKMAVFKDGAGRVIPDTVEMQQWFAAADDRRRKIALGARRLQAVTDAVGGRENVTYAHFLDPQTGGLLSAKELKAEKPEARAERVAKAQALIARRGELTRQVATFGFLHEAA